MHLISCKTYPMYQEAIRIIEDIGIEYIVDELDIYTELEDEEPGLFEAVATIEEI